MPDVLQINYVRAQEQQNIFPANMPLGLVPSFDYTFDSTGAPTSLPPDDACTVRRAVSQLLVARFWT